MYDLVTTPRGPNPILTYRSAPGPTLARWVVHRSRRKREAELFQDLQRHPWVGVRQAGHAVNLYGTTARQVDEDLRRVPYEVRLHNPPAGTFPLITGREVGTGPGPWWGHTREEDVVARGKAERTVRDEWDRRESAWKSRLRKGNDANYRDGPAVRN